jgi:hypothetical protein
MWPVSSGLQIYLAKSDELRQPTGPARPWGADRRAIATADQEWKDSARRSFDVQHLERIRVDARQMTDELVDMAGRLRAAAALLAADG